MHGAIKQIDVGEEISDVNTKRKKDDAMEACFSRSIGAEGAPCCMASVPDARLGRPVAGSSDLLGLQDAGWALDETTITYMQQVCGIYELAQTLNGDTQEMVGRYRDKLMTAGADIAKFDAAAALVVVEHAVGARQHT